MNYRILALAVAFSLGLTACGGGGGGTSGAPNPGTGTPPVEDNPPPVAEDPGTGTPPAPVDVCVNIEGVQPSVPAGYIASDGVCTLVDACLNYDGNQTLEEIADKGFVRDDASGNCQLERNHAALSTTGADVVRMMGYTGKRIGVAIVDTGFLPDHSEYVNSIMAAASYQCADANYEFDPYEKAVGDYSTDFPVHGTAVAAQAGGKKSGVAPGVSLYLKGMHSESMASCDLVIATKDAILNEGLPVINHSNSIGLNMLYWTSTKYDPYGLMSVLSNSESMFVVAAGNEAYSLSDLFDTAKSFDPQSESFLDNPQEAENVLYVGAFDRQKDELALYSNYPGHRKSFQDRFIVAGDYLYETASSSGPNNFEWTSGTSLAAPQVSGAIAILMEAKPGLTAVEAAQILLDTAQRRPEWGYGQTCTEKTELGTFTADCGAMKFGRGLMDLPKALEVAIAR